MARVLLGGRIVVDRSMAAVGVADGLAIALFVALGELRHSGTIAAGIETYTQFLIGWAIAAVVFHAYTPRAISTPRRTALVGAKTWVLAAVVGQVIRMIAEPSARFSPIFVLVSIVAGGVILVGSRVLVATD